MQRILPIRSNTLVGADPHEWIPRNFEDFLKELEHIINSCDGENPLFRGHADSKWLLESSFVRSCKKSLLGIEPHIKPSEEIRGSNEYYQSLLGLLLLKYDVLVRPCAALRCLEKEKGIDPMFELMKRYQQYPEEDKAVLKGTFFLDWSQNKDVGLFFANYDSNERYVKSRQTDGSLFICDKTATGKTLQIITVEEIMNKMVEAFYQENRAAGVPLLFYPKIQLHSQRADNQEGVYWAQMDLRYDLEYIWKLQENADKAGYIFIKLTLSYESKNECAEYLINQKVTHSYLFVE